MWESRPVNWYGPERVCHDAVVTTYAVIIIAERAG
jgi:hypothetical protein